MNEITTSTAFGKTGLTKAEHSLACQFSVRYDEIEVDMVQFCMDLAQACDARPEGSQNVFLAFALPKVSHSTRKDMVRAGRLVDGRPSALESGYGWSTLVEIAALPEEHRDWAFELPRSTREIRAYKKDLKSKTTSTQFDTTNVIPRIDPQPVPVSTSLCPVVPELDEADQASLGHRITCVSVAATNDGDPILAEHWHSVQQSDAPDSYKQAQFLLSQIELLLKSARRDGWTERHYDAFYQDLQSYATTCLNASRGYGERLKAESEARYQDAISRIGG